MRLNLLLAPLQPLNRKLVRDLWHIRGQAFAIALVIGCGVAMFIMAVGMMRSLEVTRDAYYDRYRFADAFASARRVPEYIAHRIADIPGVRTVEPRITTAAIVDIPGLNEPVTAKLHSLPQFSEPKLNLLVLREGRMPRPERADEILLLEAFAKANRLEPGDHISAILNGIKRELSITGLVLSPEYIYAIAPGQIVPDARRFGVIWMGKEHLGAAYDLDDAFNDVLLRLDRNAIDNFVLDEVDRILDPYGGVGSYLREDQISDKFLSNEMEQLKTMTGVLPPIFLAVAAFLLNVVLSRLIDQEREQIGLLKAFGYSTLVIVWHYIKMVMILTSMGIAIGFALGAWLGHGLAEIYTEFFVFPFLYFQAGLDIYALSALISLTAAIVATLFAVLSAARLTPATAMQPPAPVDYGGHLARLLSRLKMLDEVARMIFRHITRRPLRSSLAILGVALALGLRIGSESSNDNVGWMIELSFDYAERQNATLALNEPRNAAILHEIAALPAVRQVEGFRSVPAILRFGTVMRRQGLMGIADDAQLSRLIDQKDRPVTPAPFGLTISRSLADILKTELGDEIIVEIREGRRPTLKLRVTQIVDAYFGTPAFMNLAALNEVMKEGPTLTGAYVLTDKKDRDSLFKQLKNTPALAAVTTREAALRSLEETMAENLGIMTLINTIFSSLIVIGVIYNNARISLSEKARDLASLRVLGFTRAEVSAILLGEVGILTLLAIPFGVLFGMGLSHYMVASFSNDLFTVPYALSNATIGKGILTVIIAAIFSAWIVRRRIDHLDLIRVLKTRE
jgi:putative ABC transport system permease protein